MTLGSLTAGAIAINLIPTSGDVKLSLNLAVATVVVALVINLWIKVSIHALMSALVAVVVPFYLPAPAIFWVLGALVWGATVWARYYNRRHTVAELVLGTVLGLSVAILFLALR